jgi:ADP-ribosylglycohydrolase
LLSRLPVVAQAAVVTHDTEDRTGGAVRTTVMTFEARRGRVRPMLPVNCPIQVNFLNAVTSRVVRAKVRAQPTELRRAGEVAAAAVKLAVVTDGSGAWVAVHVPSDSVSTRPCSVPAVSV